ncbi:hypothetical protein BCEN4_800061 [Burkholderia cenocepacia]|nr:hypothetical protein BCEN4_800061 [Burkholderia cenocepacia]
MPVRNRHATSMSAFTENAPTSENALYHPSVSRNALRRPMRSARLPRHIAPTNMPMNADASNSLKSALCRLSPYSCCNAEPIVLTRKISYMSKNSPTPITQTTNRCNAPTGRSSMKSPSVTRRPGRAAASAPAPAEAAGGRADSGPPAWPPRSRDWLFIVSPDYRYAVALGLAFATGVTRRPRDATAGIAGRVQAPPVRAAPIVRYMVGKSAARDNCGCFKRPFLSRKGRGRAAARSRPTGRRSLRGGGAYRKRCASAPSRGAGKP